MGARGRDLAKNTLPDEECDEINCAIAGGQLSQDTAQQSLDTTSSWWRLTIQLSIRALGNPRIAVDLLHLAWAFRARVWYRIPPFLPLPPREYLQWRMHTMYGDEGALPSVDDILRFARWRREVMHS